MKEKIKEIQILNKKARYEFALEDKYTAGMALTGTEIKSIRDGNANITDAFCAFESGELYLLNAHISVYKQGTHYNHEPLRKRKLLLNKKELRKLEKGIKTPGYTIVPLKITESDTGYAKLEISLARGKKDFDKRDDIKKRDVDRELKRFE